MNEKGLNIIKARVEQDKYQSEELRIIKANGENILKDLYIEKEFMDGKFYSCSDNVLVSLHRTLREGEVSNLGLISNKAEILTPDIFKSIDLVDNLFICVKSVSDMETVLNNQKITTDIDKKKVEDDNKIIKDQMIKASVDDTLVDEDIKFLYEDPYNEVIVYKIEEDNDKYKLTVVGDKASFIAVDSCNIYVHSNNVNDLTKIELIKEKSDNMNNEVNLVDNKIETEEMPKVDLEEKKEEKQEETSVETSVEEETPSVENNVVEEEKEYEEEIKEEYVSDEEYDQLSEMITKLVTEQKEALDKIKEYEESIKKLEDIKTNNEKEIKELTTNLDKANKEVDNKTKKVNTLINENRKYIDENNLLKNNLKEKEEELTKVESDNDKLKEENKQLREEAIKGKTKIDAVISSLGEVLNNN